MIDGATVAIEFGARSNSFNRFNDSTSLPSAPHQRRGAHAIAVALPLKRTSSPLAFWPGAVFCRAMTAEAIIEEIKSLPPAERMRVAKFVVEQDDSWIPDSFKQGMADAVTGRLVEMDTALRETPPPHLR